MQDRLKKQLEFMLELDKMKNLYRHTYVLHEDRKENDAEHSWHLAILAFLLAEYSNENINVPHVMKMVLLHDVVEIDAGDTYAYDEEGLKTQKAREDAAKERIYSLLPDDQKDELIRLFDEFEAYETMESKFAHAMDNLQPLLLNDSNNGADWVRDGATAEKVYKRQRLTALGSQKLFEVVDDILKKNIEKGNL